MLSEGSSVKGSPEGKQPPGPCFKRSAKISRLVSQALYTGNVLIDTKHLITARKRSLRRL